MSLGKLDGVQDTKIGKAIIPASQIGKVGRSDLITGVSHSKFYFPSSGSPAVSPAYSASWYNSSYVTRYALVYNKISSAFTSDIHTQIGGTGYKLFKQYVSPAMVAQTVAAGTITGQMKCYCGTSGASNYSYLSVKVRVCNSSGTITQEITNIFKSNSFFSTSYNSGLLTNRKILDGASNPTYSSFTVSEGDRLVLELGYYNATSVQIRFRIGDNSSTDLPEDETTSSDYCDWIQFSNGILFPS